MHGQFSGLIIHDKHGDKHGATLANNLDFCSNLTILESTEPTHSVGNFEKSSDNSVEV